MKTSEVLRKAGDVLRERGWFQGRSSDELGQRVCVVGALRVAAGSGHPDTLPIEPQAGGYEEARDTLAAFVGIHDSLWNDTPGRTAAEVMIALDAAYIVALQEEGVEPEDVL